MDKEAREFFKELKQDIKELNQKVDDLMSWKNKLMGMFIAVSAMSTFLINEIKEYFGIV